MAKPRSPNYPSLSLPKAIEALRPVFKQENRNKMSRMVLAKHLGSNSLNGRVLGRIGALRAYGLLDGNGDDLRVSDDGLVLLNAPEGSQEKRAAIERSAFRPVIFKQLRDESPDLINPPSEENIRYSLIKRGYNDSAAGKAAKSYRGTIGLVIGKPAMYDVPEETADKDASDPPKQLAEVGDLVLAEVDGVQAFDKPKRVRAVQDYEGRKWVHVEGEETGLQMDQVTVVQKASSAAPKPPILPEDAPADARPKGGEREWLRGPLSRETSYRLIVMGDLGPKEIAKLIKLLEAQKAVLEDDIFQ